MWKNSVAENNQMQLSICRTLILLKILFLFFVVFWILFLQSPCLLDSWCAYWIHAYQLVVLCEENRPSHALFSSTKKSDNTYTHKRFWGRKRFCENIRKRKCRNPKLVIIRISFWISKWDVFESYEGLLRLYRSFKLIFQLVLWNTFFSSYIFIIRRKNSGLKVHGYALACLPGP